MNIIIDYFPSDKCKKSLYTCLKCGECGRKFDEQGVMVESENDGASESKSNT